MNLIKKFQNQKGLTLIELLIVIAVIGILAAIILVAIDPLEQFARGRDASRKSSVGQLGHAAQAFNTASGGTTFPVANAAWMTALQQQGEIQNLITGPAYSVAGIPANGCAPGAGGFNQNKFCYTSDGLSWSAIWVRLESKSDGGQGGLGSKCPTPGQIALWVYHTAVGQAGRVCAANTYVPPAVFDVTMFSP